MDKIYKKAIRNIMIILSIFFVCANCVLFFHSSFAGSFPEISNKTLDIKIHADFYGNSVQYSVFVWQDSTWNLIIREWWTKDSTVVMLLHLNAEKLNSAWYTRGLSK